MTQSRPDWMRPVDDSILRVLARERTEYPSLIASRAGLHIPVVERRCSQLTVNGFVEPVSEEVVYRLTERGRQYVDEHTDVRSADP